ncbi:MAG: hypothetical protein ACREAM_18510, partial [Blastocatellia bacterium]
MKRLPAVRSFHRRGPRVFPRQINGHPIVGPKDKSLKLEFKHPRTGDQNEQRVLVEFKLDKALINNT